jgi:hypothetical protein
VKEEYSATGHAGQECIGMYSVFISITVDVSVTAAQKKWATTFPKKSLPLIWRKSPIVVSHNEGFFLSSISAGGRDGYRKNH